ncbi:helix-turn-helix transcriptional regulator [Paracoccus sanguinis]|uniref:Peptidase S24/S26A/S26B/S26C domain-containing protein n=1 Tax=Paracoccus sanguinis TaxID=1545044 RepID=A0A099GKA4_9RHOB|nr:S24 family peptidase [Paracoccus sanguinis]KGJ23249.1 hypothetical protein IX56_03020 [Paracoccus sanguinis]
MDFAELVLQKLDERGENVNSFEAKMGWKQGFLRAFVRDDAKRSQPTIDKARLILGALGEELYIGERQPVIPPKQIRADDEYASIPIHDAFLAAGYAAQNDTEAVIGHLAFRRDWLDRMGIAADKARIARVRGDSMAPTLHDDDMVLIDTGSREVAVRRRGPEDRRRPPIFAVNTADGPRIKRVERPETGQMQLLSDNNEFPVEVLTGDRLKRAEIIGRVVWWGHTVRDE